MARGPFWAGPCLGHARHDKLLLRRWRRRRRRSREGGGSSSGILLRGRPPVADATDLDAEADGSGRIPLRYRRHRRQLKGRGGEGDGGAAKRWIEARCRCGGSGKHGGRRGGGEARCGVEGGEADNTVKPLGSMATEEAREKRGRDSIRTTFSSSESTDESAMAEEWRWWMRGCIEEDEDDDDEGELT